MPRFPTCKASKHVKYNPYNTLESKQVPKSTVKITLPDGNVEGKKKKHNTKGKVKPKTDRILKKRKNKHGKVTFELFSVQMVFCHKRSSQAQRRQLSFSLESLHHRVILSMACNWSGVPLVSGFSRSWRCPGHSHIRDRIHSNQKNSHSCHSRCIRHIRSLGYRIPGSSSFHSPGSIPGSDLRCKIPSSITA